MKPKKIDALETIKAMPETNEEERIAKIFAVQNAKKKLPKKTAQDVVDLVKKEKTAEAFKSKEEIFPPVDPPATTPKNMGHLLDEETIKIRSKEAKRQEYIKDMADAKAARIADREKRKAEKKPVKKEADKETRIAEFIKDFEEKKAAGHLTFKDDEYRFALYLPADLYKTLKIKTIQDGTTLSKLIAKQMAKLVEK